MHPFDCAPSAPASDPACINGRRSTSVLLGRWCFTTQGKRLLRPMLWRTITNIFEKRRDEIEDAHLTFLFFLDISEDRQPMSASRLARSLYSYQKG